jgi:hypothetical protein
MAAGHPQEALGALEEASVLAGVDSLGAVAQQTLTLCLAQALAQTIPAEPSLLLFTRPDLYSIDPSAGEFLVARARIEFLVGKALAESRTMAADIQAGQILAQAGDSQEAIGLIQGALKSERRFRCRL